MKKCYKKFSTRTQEYSALLISAHQVKANKAYVRSLNERSAITDIAFLRFFVAWEAFLEESMILYATGSVSTSGSIIKRLIIPQSQQHAHEIAINGSRFIEWSAVDAVRRLAKLFFDQSAPYDVVLSSIVSVVEDSKIIRNSIAHISATTSHKLDILASRILQKPVKEITTYELLMSNTPINQPIETTVYEYYSSQIEIAAELIARA